MKYLKNSLIFLIILLFAFSTFAFSEKRNLSTPLSRLVGHWQSTKTGEQLYFSPLPTSSFTTDLIGSHINVSADKETLKNLLDKMKKSGEMTNAQIIKAKEELKDYESTATYSKYKVLTQEPNGLKIVIEIFLKDLPFLEDDWFECIVNVDKDGKKMTMLFGDEPAHYIFIDSKTSPEDRK